MSENFRITLTIIVAILVFCVLYQYFHVENKIAVVNVVDENGCLSSAGYVWSGYVGACIRDFELSKTQKAVAKIAIESIGQTKGLSVTTVEEGGECVGCFFVKTVVAGTDESNTVNIENWAVANSNKNSVISIEEAIGIAEASVCVDEGELLADECMYNENSHSWWINMTTEKENCYPACVVYSETKTAEINWRCTGLLEEETPEDVI